MTVTDPFAVDIRVVDTVGAPASPQSITAISRAVCTKSACNCTFNPFACGSFIPGVC
jgi:hypothetical protein